MHGKTKGENFWHQAPQDWPANARKTEKRSSYSGTIFRFVQANRALRALDLDVTLLIVENLLIHSH